VARFTPNYIYGAPLIYSFFILLILFIDAPLQILSNLDAEDLARFSCISKLSKAICDSPSVWKKVYQQRWIEQNECEVDGDNWKQKYQDRAKIIKPLTQLLAREDISLLTALFQVVNKKSNSFSERRELMDSVACLLEADYKMPHVLNNTLSIEINHLAKAGATVSMRGTTLAGDLFYSYANLISGPYLKSTFEGIVRDICDREESLELDARYMKSTDNRQRHVYLIKKIIKKILRRLNDTAHQFPIQLRAVVARMTELMRELKPDNADNHIQEETNFIIQKFILPSFIRPEGYGIIAEEDPSLHSRRKLIVVAVVLAKVCSETEFCEVEQDYMILNDFIFEKNNIDTKRRFIDGLSDFDKSLLDDRSRVGKLRVEDCDKALATLVQFCATNMEDIDREWSLRTTDQNVCARVHSAFLTILFSAPSFVSSVVRYSQRRKPSTAVR
jgi:hypothetical protein